ncbi:MAG: helix-turn-helix domain-containing protein [Defluviitaleaceae bacterium]|nr:helix-turn-helix domain-containing protein [Defluviitaleaceae bacterium]MCL2273814.1 helix-turn-helix domain-containing protein [Defluviitaleaceae bacterium]
MKLNIGANIHRLRGEKQITQEQLAEHLLISCQAVSKWETDITTPDITLLPAIADFFDVQIDELFKTDMSGYRNKAERLAAKYDMHGKKEDYEKATAEYERLLANENAEAEDYSGYARLQIFRTEALTKAAESLLNQAIEMGDESAEHQLITLLSKQNRANESIEKYKRQCKVNPQNPKNWHKLIHAYYPIGRDYNAPKNPAKALETAKTGIANFPQDAFMLCLCGFVCHGEEKYEEALTCWEKSMHLDPEIIDNYYAIARLHEVQSRPANAITVYEKLIAFYQSKGLHEHTHRPGREIARISQ